MQPGLARPSKRPAQEPPSEEPTSKKIHPFFSNPGKVNEQFGSFRWLPSLGKNKTCLHGVNLEPKGYPKVAAFDLDGTIIKAQIYSGSSQWEWWNSVVLGRLQDLVRNEYAIVFLSNQAIKPGMLKQWKEKVTSIGSAFECVPFRIFAATAKDGYRKPMLGMWQELDKIFREQGVVIDLGASFYVGDAAGRTYKNRKSDFSSTDRKLALNIGVTFKTPEEYFLDLPVHLNYVLPGFHVSSIEDLPRVTPTSIPIIPHPKGQPEVVVFCGYPAMGKTRFYHQHFQPVGYVHINQDTLRTRDKCVKATREALQDGKSCVIDNTNRDTKTRKYYIEVANQFNVPIRCFVFSGSIELAWHNNLYRSFNLPLSASAQELRRDLVPYSAFTSFREQYEKPTNSEGFSEIRQVNWKFEGAEEEKKYWSMWMQIDGI